MSTSRRPYRVAIIGTGGIAQAHADALTALSDRVSLVAVADVDPARAAEFAHRNSVANIYSDPQALLDAVLDALNPTDADDVTLVGIART